MVLATAVLAIGAWSCEESGKEVDKTKPTIGQVDHACRMLDFEGLIDRALANTELVKVRYHD